MASITTRQTTGGGASVKNAPLTNVEIDTNFINLNIDKIEVSNAVSTNTANAVVRRNGTGGFSAGAISVGAVTATSLSLTTALPPASGGTGQNTYTNGQLLIGNTTGNTLTRATLTGTSNQITVTNGAGSITLSLPQSIATTSAVQFGSMGIGVAASATAGTLRVNNSLGVGTAPSGTSGQIRASDSIIAFQTSDIKFKENIRDIPNALDVVLSIGGKFFDWKDEYIQDNGGEDGYYVRKNDFGVIAQDVKTAFPLAVRTKDDGTLAVDYEKLCALAFAAIKELNNQIQEIKGIK